MSEVFVAAWIAFWAIFLALSGSVTATSGSIGLVCPTWDDDIDVLYHEEHRKCYVLGRRVCTWSCVKHVCERNSAMLVKVNSSASLEHMKRALISYTSYRWQLVHPIICFVIGANDRSEEGHWVWTDGDPVKNDVWGFRFVRRQQGKDCVKMCAVQDFGLEGVRVSSMYFERASCEDNYFLMCQQDKIPVTLPGITQEPDLKQDGVKVSDTWICRTWTNVHMLDPFYRQEGQSCYVIPFKRKDFDEARDICTRNDATMVKVNSPTVFSHLEIAIMKFYQVRNLNPDSSICIMTGANDRDEEGTWVWTDGEQVTPAPWQTLEGWSGWIFNLIFDCAGICARNGVTMEMESFKCENKHFACQYDAVKKLVPVEKLKAQVKPIFPIPAYVPKVAVMTIRDDLAGYVLLDRPDWSHRVFTSTQCGRKCTIERCKLFVFCQKPGCCKGYNKMPPMPLNLVRGIGCPVWEFKLV